MTTPLKNSSVNTFSNNYLFYDILKKIYFYHVEKYINNYLSEIKLNDLKRGLKILENEKEVSAYISFYGALHFEKLILALKEINDYYLLNNIIRIYDWGCGQALGTLVLLNYLSKHKNNFIIKELNLIEPSKISLIIGEKYLKRYFQIHCIENVKINSYNNKIENLNFDVFNENKCTYSGNIINIHIFSNVLDIFNDYINKFNCLKNFSGNFNLFLCIGPNDLNSRKGIDALYSIYKNSDKLINISYRNEILTTTSYRYYVNQIINNVQFSNYHRIFIHKIN